MTPLQKAALDITRHNQLFAVVSWGCAATKWLAKVLNSHPEILCLHAGNQAVARFHSVMDSLQYLRVLSILGYGYKATGDVHGLPRTEIAKVKEVFGTRLNVVIVVREPIARLRSQMELFESLRGMDVWALNYLERLIEEKNITVNSEETRMFVHAANMLNAVTEEISLGTIYKAEDLTSDPNVLAALVAEIGGGQVDTNREWVEKCLGLEKVNPHAKREARALRGWEIDIMRAVVSPQSWRIYQELGYAKPSFVG